MEGSPDSLYQTCKKFAKTFLVQKMFFNVQSWGDGSISVIIELSLMTFLHRLVVACSFGYMVECLLSGCGFEPSCCKLIQTSTFP